MEKMPIVHSPAKGPSLVPPALDVDPWPQPSNETSEVTFFSQEEIPEILSGERTRPRHILDAFAAQSNPDYRAVFD